MVNIKIICPNVNSNYSTISIPHANNLLKIIHRQSIRCFYYNFINFILAEVSQPGDDPKDIYGCGGDLHNLTKLSKDCLRFNLVKP